MLRKVYYICRLLLSFAVQLVLSNIDVARTVLRSRVEIRPGIVRYPTSLRTDTAITWLANLITLTPGTLTIDVSTDHQVLYIHTLNVGEPAEVIASIKASFEAYLLELEK